MVGAPPMDFREAACDKPKPQLLTNPLNSSLTHSCELSAGMENPLPAEFYGSLDPVDWRSIRAQGHRMLDDIFDYAENIRDRPVWQPIPDQVRTRFREDLPAAPTALAAVHGAFMHDI